jgi:hexosaminidase
MVDNLYEKLLIPVKKIILQKGFFRWPAHSFTAYSNSSDIEQSLLSFDRKTRGATIRINRDKRITDGEAYRLLVDSSGVEISVGADAGAYYALQTLRELMKIYGNTLPYCRIEDKPDFRRRGVLCDCSRGKVPKLSTLKELVERLAQWKINELQLYIENVFTFKRHPSIGKGYSPFTPEEILALQDCCRSHHIKLVGTMASFGHLEKILALPRYRHLGEMPGFRNYPGGTTLCPIDPGSIKLISQLYDEFMPLFDAEDFNVCCDETWELGKGRSKTAAERLGTGRVYLDFLLKIYSLCQKHGKRMNLWADILLKYPQLLKELPKDIVLLNWEYEQDGANIKRTREIAQAGLAFMVCPGTSSWQTHGTRLPNSINNVARFAEVGRKYHADGLLNTDWGDDGHRNFLGVSLHSFAHGAAHAWNGRAVDNEKFTERFCFHFFGQKDKELAKYIRLLGSNYITCGHTVPNKSLLYQALIEPLMPGKDAAQSLMDLMTEKGLRKIVSLMSGFENRSFPYRSAEKFERLAAEELMLAGRMDELAAKRDLVAKALRKGEQVKLSELKQLNLQMRELAKDFKRLWLKRNKPSRLSDNLKLFREAQILPKSVIYNL